MSAMSRIAPGTGQPDVPKSSNSRSISRLSEVRDPQRPAGTGSAPGVFFMSLDLSDSVIFNSPMSKGSKPGEAHTSQAIHPTPAGLAASCSRASGADPDATACHADSGSRVARLPAPRLTTINAIDRKRVPRGDGRQSSGPVRAERRPRLLSEAHGVGGILQQARTARERGMLGRVEVGEKLRLHA